MDKWVLVFYCNPTKWPEAFMVEATLHEIRLLEEVDNVAEHVARSNLDMKQAHITILHYLGKSCFYENEEEFDHEKKGFRDAEWDEESLDRLTWFNYGKWALGENIAASGDCRGAWHFYHIHIDA